ncbi:MAG: PhzF family phenazine biosynthesis protein [Lachnospiraceae bacterium]|nr:PhzF family phenazine biosynthesis protein [Lachnospiraceae bacterium]
MAEVYVTSAFSKNNSGGNKAGVVVQDYHLEEEQKKELASQLGYSETAFISHSDCADFKIEYFTPEGEVPLCGHATIASFVTMNSLHMLEDSHYSIETKSGILKIDMDETGMVFMEQNNPVFYEKLEKSDLADCLDPALVAQNLPIQIVSTGLRDILVPIDSPKHLREARPDFKAMSAVSESKDVIGLHAFSLVNSHELTAVCRNFAPLYGIDEESATGTSNCALACYLFHYGQKQTEYIFEQGHNLGSVSRIVVHLEHEKDAITKVAVGGHGYLNLKETFKI